MQPLTTPEMSSGARYSGVPQRVYVRSPGATYLAKPKSTTLSIPLDMRQRFSGCNSECK
jgi:hypothetical protein